MNSIQLLQPNPLVPDAGAAVGLGFLWFAVAVVLYVWTALALSAVFRKSGEEAWKAWVPFYNQYTFLQLGGLSGWLVLVQLFPVLGPLALWAAVVVAAHRVNASFGFGTGMTVLAALLFPVWASVVGFGSARWIGASVPTGPRRGADVVEGRTPAPRWAPPADVPSEPAFGPDPGPGGDRSSAGRPAGTDGSAPPPSAAAWAPSASDDGDDDDLDGGGSRPAAPSSWAPAWSPGAAEDARPVRRSEFDSSGVDEFTGEVTGAVAGAPAPISAVPVPPHDAPPPITTVPAVTRVPAAPPATAREPWAPARSPLADPDAFPEASGEVSAVAGAPDAGAPRSAMSTVSAQSAYAGVPDAPIEETIIARRRRTGWTLAPAGAAPIPLTSEVVILGRRPSIDPDFPDAQRIAVADETRTMSKTHARLELRGDFWAVVDLDSTNGVILIGEDGAETETPPGVLSRLGARFLLGDAELRLTSDTAVITEPPV